MALDAVVMGARSGQPPMMGPSERPALEAWVREHRREQKRMGLATDRAYAQWLGVDPADWSRWWRGEVDVPGRQGRRLVTLFDHNARFPVLWLRLSHEQERRKLAQTGRTSRPDG